METFNNIIKKINIREFQISDYDDLNSLYLKSELPYKPEGRDSYNNLKKQIKNDSCNIFLAISGNDIVGSVLVTHDTRKGWINRLAVAPEYRRKGIASKLVKKAEQWLENEHIKIFACLIEGWNKNSMKVFEELGYKKFPDIAYYTKRKYKDI